MGDIPSSPFSIFAGTIQQEEGGIENHPIIQSRIHKYFYFPPPDRH
jgi:hypothetical protein